MQLHKHVVTAGLAVGLALTWAGVSGVANASATKQAVQAPASGYAGEDTCLTCHEDQAYKGSAHARRANPRTPAAGLGCESCHGPGQEHAESGGDKTKIMSYKDMTPEEQSETCTSCHNRGDHALWAGSQHDNRKVSCTSCHSVHNGQGPSEIKTKTEMELCSSCHRGVATRQYRFNHMPVREGKMSCASCHNVHGSSNIKLLRAGTTIDESCVSCHTEKRGPYLWEHAPVAESCTTCHDAHGSNNDRMLVAKQPFLCQRCHVTSRHPPTVYEGYTLQNSQNANKIFGRSCLNCHQQIHGSNAPSGKAFLR
ncbi:MAG: DmsE family decaheme c-type cytochrome [Vicinamibacteraceae bacterium]|nr:DmsE family decaheme c-type cytochrome [Vicinamibacteraceae bacterium]